jgi:sortase A
VTVIVEQPVDLGSPAGTPEAGVPRAPDGDRRHRSPRPHPGPAKGIAVSLTLLSLLLLGFPFYLWALSGLQESGSQTNLYSEFREELRLAVAPVQQPSEYGSPVAILAIPGIGQESVVVEGSSSDELMLGPGHRSDTPLPGQQGTSVVQGRRAAFGAPFGGIAGLKPDDPIVVTTGQGRFEYRVHTVRTSDDPIPLAPAEGPARLALVTSDPAWTPARNVIVTALLAQGKPQPLVGGVGIAPASQEPLSGQPAALVPLLLWSQLLLVTVLASAVAWHRIPRVYVWIAAAPATAAIAWNVYQNIAALLPNTL